MKQELCANIDGYIDTYCADNQLQRLWRKPIAGYADANHPEVQRLKTLVGKEHFLPEDFLPEAKTIVSYFLPFLKEIADSNIAGDDASSTWANAYITTNTMAIHINRHIVSVVEKWGYRAAIPENIGFTAEKLKSPWSQRHVARIAGLGTFGINNMLITKEGCCGRFFSVVTDLPVAPDPVETEERCLNKNRGTCGICVKRCVGDAFSGDSFDRFKCYEVCEKNAAVYPGAAVCGKCDVGLPCSFHSP